MTTATSTSDDDASSGGPGINTPAEETPTSSVMDDLLKVIAAHKGIELKSDAGTSTSKSKDEVKKDAESDDQDEGKPKEDTEQKSLDPKLVGLSSGFRNLYSGKEDDKGRYQWQSTIPEDIGTPAEDAETQKWALIVRYNKVYNDPSRVLAIHSILVQSPLLKELLKVVLKGYPGVTVGLHKLEFSGKFEPLIHRWSQLSSAIADLRVKVKEASEDPRATEQSQAHDAKADQNPAAGIGKEELVNKDGKPQKTEKATTEASTEAVEVKSEDATKSLDELDVCTRLKLKLEHAELLQKTLKTEFQTTIDESQDMIEKSVMTFDYLWTLFQPSSFVYTKIESHERVLQLENGRYAIDCNNNHVFCLQMRYVETDGIRFGHETMNMNIKTFKGTRSVTSLQCYPFGFHAQKDELKTKLITRGAKVESLFGTHYKAYNGVGWRLDQYDKVQRHAVKGRIIVDPLRFNRFNPDDSVDVYLFKDENVDDGDVAGTDISDTSSLDIYEGHRDRDYAPGQTIDDDDEEQPPLTDEQKLIMTPMVRGYALKKKLWLNLYADEISEIDFNERAFESLVLPESQKDLILGFTASQRDYSEQFDDVIQGKGQGIIILLSGPPGVGKTLTAESVAEEMRVPLFVLSAGDLGLDPHYIESKLNEIFEMVSSWKAILLLDEADVFLEERSLHEIERNKLVSIFLRVLEYYEGIMFLTTNRVQTFDAAFQSRIHISLDYPELSIESRKQVWLTFLKQHDVVQKANRERGPVKRKASTGRALGAKLGSKSATPCAGTDTGKTASLSGLPSSGNGETETQAGDASLAKDEDAAAQRQHEELTQPHCITDKEVSGLARIAMNGRQIKNILKTAQLLASRKKESLSRKHITQVLEVTQHLHNSTLENERTKSSIFC